MNGRYLSISEFAQAIGKSVPTVRRMEKEGTIPQPRRAANGWRYYDQADVTRVRAILYPETLTA